MPTRMRPLVSSMLYAARRACTVETSASGEVEPSLGRKIGSSPPVASKRARMPAALTPMFSLGWCEVTHRRPFTPRSRKNGKEHTSELQSPYDVVCRLLLEKKK